LHLSLNSHIMDTAQWCRAKCWANKNAESNRPAHSTDLSTYLQSGRLLQRSTRPCRDRPSECKARPCGESRFVSTAEPRVPKLKLHELGRRNIAEIKAQLSEAQAQPTFRSPVSVMMNSGIWEQGFARQESILQPTSFKVSFNGTLLATCQLDVKKDPTPNSRSPCSLLRDNGR
jgi:hypothetical protein